MYVGDPSAIDAFQAQHEAALEVDFNTVRSQDILFEILPKARARLLALQALSQTLGYSRDQVMALGDANNDLEMLRLPVTASRYGKWQCCCQGNRRLHHP